MVNFFQFFLKLLPLQGDFVNYVFNPGCCPGLGASALSGRVGQTILACGANNLRTNKRILLT